MNHRVQNWDRPRATGYQPTEFKGSLHLQRGTCRNGCGKTTSIIPLIIFRFGEFGSPVRACNKFLDYSTPHVEILNLISLFQRKWSLWFHRALRFSESMANPTRYVTVCFKSHLRDVCLKSASEEFLAHCITGKAFFMCQKKSRCGKSHVLTTLHLKAMKCRWSLLCS